MYLIDYLNNYIPVNEQEIKDLCLMKEFYYKYPNTYLSRENEIGHFTASCWIANKDFTKILMGYHIIYDNWGWLGGHADGMDDLLMRAKLEANEESGLISVVPYLEEPISIEILPVPRHIKNNKVVNEHIHLNLTFLFIADEFERLEYRPDEHKGIKWVNIEDVINFTDEECMKPIYQKLNAYIYKHVRR